MHTWGDSLISLLTDDEVAEVHRLVAEHVASRAITIACDNMWWLGKSREFARYAMDLFMAKPPEWAPSTPADLAGW